MRARHPTTRRQVLAALAGLCLGAGPALLLQGCAPTGGGRETPATASDQYRWDCIEVDGNGRRSYCPDGVLSSRSGIDVSEHNGAIDWSQVCRDGIEFAMVRVGRRGYTQGGLYADERVGENLAGIRKVGLPFGAYFFSSAINEDEAREEARLALELLGSARPVLPVVYDHETVSDAAGRTNGLSSAQYTSNARAFCETVEAAGFKPMIYGNRHDLARLDLDQLPWDIWYAEYGVSRPSSGTCEFTMWQYTDHGSVAGIEGGVDLNIQFVVDASQKAIIR